MKFEDIKFDEDTLKLKMIDADDVVWNPATFNNVEWGEVKIASVSYRVYFDEKNNIIKVEKIKKNT